MLNPCLLAVRTNKPQGLITFIDKNKDGLIHEASKLKSYNFRIDGRDSKDRTVMLFLNFLSRLEIHFLYLGYEISKSNEK